MSDYLLSAKRCVEGRRTDNRKALLDPPSSILLSDRVFRIILVPLGHQLIAGLADVLIVEDRAGEDAWHFDLVTQFLDRMIDGAFQQASAVREQTQQFRLLYGVALV